jgi:hypothetical protein
MQWRRRQTVSASNDSTQKVWDVETAECLATVTCDGAVFNRALIDPLNPIVASDAGGHLHFFRLEEPKARK